MSKHDRDHRPLDIGALMADMLANEHDPEPSAPGDTDHIPIGLSAIVTEDDTDGDESSRSFADDLLNAVRETPRSHPEPLAEWLDRHADQFERCTETSRDPERADRYALLAQAIRWLEATAILEDAATVGELRSSVKEASWQLSGLLVQRFGTETRAILYRAMLGPFAFGLPRPDSRTGRFKKDGE
jgi:hypothetical protein